MNEKFRGFTQEVPDFEKKEKKEKKESLIASNVDGKIKEVVMGLSTRVHHALENPADIVYHSDMLLGGDASGMNLLAIKNLLKTLPEGVTLKVVVWKNVGKNDALFLHNFHEALRASGIDPGRVKLEIVENKNQNLDKNWMRDYYLLSADGKKMYISNHKTPDAKRFLHQLAVELNVEPIETPFIFEGGDLKSVGGKTYVSGETVLDNLGEDFDLVEYNNFLKSFSNFFQTEIVVVGEKELLKRMQTQDFFEDDRFPPLFHLDLYYTPLGKNKQGKDQVAIGDVQMLVNILKEDGDGYRKLADSFFEVKKQKKEELSGFTNPNEMIKNADEGIKMFYNFYTNPTGSINTRYIKLKKYLDDVADEAVSRDMEVVRVPIMPKGGSILNDRRAALLTYNNSLVENYVEDRDQKRRIWMPNYGVGRKSRSAGDKRISTDMLNIVDREAEKVFRQAGLDVCNIDLGMESTTYGGSLNCRLSEIREL